MDVLQPWSSPRNHHKENIAAASLMDLTARKRNTEPKDLIGFICFLTISSACIQQLVTSHNETSFLRNYLLYKGAKLH